MRRAHFLLAAAALGSMAVASEAQAQRSQDRRPPASPPLPGEPIVPDSQFEEALPPLDPDLNRPLEPIETIEPITIDPNAPPFPPEPGPVGDAPLGDPALAEPLAPLSTLEVEPLAPETEPAEAESTVRYALVVEGLGEIGLEDEFRGLSALQDARGRATNGAMVQNRAREDEALALRLLRAEGYYDAVVTHSISQVPPEGDTIDSLRVVITAAPGQRYNFGEIRIDGPPTEPTDLARRSLPLDSGAPVRAIDVEAAEANVLLRLPQQGYPFPEIGLRDILLDPDTGLGDYTLPLQPGPRSRFAGFTTEGNLAFDAEHVGILARFSRGELYDRRMVDDLREAMVATRLFTTVSAEPVRTGELAPDGTEYVNILVRQEAGPARSLDASAGFSTGEGLRIEGAWEHRNLFPPEGSLRLSAVAGTREQSASIRFRRNNWGQRDRAILLQADAGRRDYPAFEGYTARLHGLITRESTPIWQKVWTYAYGAEILATNENSFNRARVSFIDAYYIAGLIGQLGYDRSNSLLDPTSGFRLLGRVNPEVQHRLGETDYYARNLIEGSAYYPVGEQFVIAGRARFGSIFGIERDELAPSRRLYAGGGGSVRGFGYQQLGPRVRVANPNFDPDDEDEEDPETILVPIGGRGLSEFAIEGRYRFGNYGVVAFIDAGSVTESQYPTFEDMRFGIGIGGRVYTNFGPLRVDIATPIGRREGESWLNIYVSIGQAF